MTLEEFNNTQGHCPKCGSDDIDEERHNDEVVGYDDVPWLRPYYHCIDGSIAGVYIKSHCNKCGCEFNQRYKLLYAGQELRT